MALNMLDVNTPHIVLSGQGNKKRQNKAIIFPLDAGDWARVWEADPERGVLWAVTHLAIRDLLESQNGKRRPDIAAEDLIEATALVADLASSSDEAVVALLSVLVDQEDQLVKRKERNMNGAGRTPPSRPNKLKEIMEEHGVVQQAILSQVRMATNILTAIGKHEYYPGDEVRAKLAQALTEITGETITETDIWPQEKEKE